MVDRIDIERALDGLISNEETFRFQGLAVALAQDRWWERPARRKPRKENALMPVLPAQRGESQVTSLVPMAESAVSPWDKG